MFRSCSLSLSCFCTFLVIPAQCSGTFFKLVENDGDALEMDGRVPFLTQAFFSCDLNEACEEVAKITGTSEFNEVIDQHRKKEVSVYRKDNTPKIKDDPTWSAWSMGECNAECGGGTRTLIRFCYSHLPCIGKSSEVENCNKEGCPDLQDCKYDTTELIDGSWGVSYLWLAGQSWYPLLNLEPSCQKADGVVLTRVHLEQRGIDVQYNYSCCNFKDTVCRMTVKRTAWQYGGDGNAKYLSMHQINCGRFGFISSFQLEHKSSKIRYLYTCCELFNPRWRNQLQCYEAATPYVSENAQLVYSLAQIPVSCNGGFGFSSFQLQKKAAMQQWRFEFRCCRVEY